MIEYNAAMLSDLIVSHRGMGFSSVYKVYFTLSKLLFIRTKELQKKWSTGYIPNWSMVMNQLLLHDQIKDRVIKYLE